jgi:hypothetical protein
VYLYNPNSVTHCCELTASYELINVGSIVGDAEKLGELSEEKREELFDWLREGQGQDEYVRYMHCSAVESMTELKDSTALEAGRCKLGDFGETPADGNYKGFGEDKFKEAMDEAEEYVRGNGYTDT